MEYNKQFNEIMISILLEDEITYSFTELQRNANRK